MQTHNPLINASFITVPHARVEYGKGIGTFSDREYLFIYTVGGTSEWHVEGRRYLLGLGNCLLLPPHIPHTVKPEGEIVQYIAHFVPGPNQRIPDEWPFVVQVNTDDREWIETLFGLLLKEFRKTNGKSITVITGLMTTMLGIYSRYTGDRVYGELRVAKTWKNISRAVQVMQSKPEAPHTVESLAHHCGLSVSYFCRTFLQHTGYSPHEFLNRVRIQRAKLLLLDPHFNCSDVAVRVGYSSIHVFSKVFKRHENRSPTDYAKNPWKR